MKCPRSLSPLQSSSWEYLSGGVDAGKRSQGFRKARGGSQQWDRMLF